MYHVYQPRVGVEDAITYLLNRVYAHLDKPGSPVRVTSFDFSSTLNTIRPALLGDKLTVMLCPKIVDYHTGLPQYVHLQHCVLDAVVSNTGALLGTVLSPFLFTLYTTDFSYQTEPCHLHKFSDDSAVVGCISRVRRLSTGLCWTTFTRCELNHLQLNPTKTKELVVDLRRTRTQNKLKLLILISYMMLTISLYIVYISRLCTLLLYNFIVYFISFHFIVYFAVLCIYLSLLLFTLMLYFYPTLHGASGTKTISPPGINRVI